MNILIVGATRGIGRQVLEHALASGHSVTALVRDPQRLARQHERLRVVTGDILDTNSVAVAMDGQNAVCCSIGVKVPWPIITVFSEGTKNLLRAMKQAAVKRLICVTGTSSRTPILDACCSGKARLRRRSAHSSVRSSTTRNICPR